MPTPYAVPDPEAALAALRAVPHMDSSASWHASVLAAIDQGFCVIELIFDGQSNPVDYRFLETNPAFEAQTGIRDAIGRRMREIAPDHEEFWFERYGRVATTGQPVRFEAASVALDRTYQVHAFRVDRPEACRVAIVFSDITAQLTEAARSRESELKLRESELRFRRLADAMPQLVWTALPSGVVDYYNRQATRYDGIRRGDDGTWSWQPTLHPDDVDRTVRAWEHAVTTGQTYECEHRVSMADGTLRWHLSRAYRIGAPGAQQWFGTATDIHDLKVAQERLRQSEQRFKAIANTAPAMLWITDARHRCTFLSRGWSEFTGQAEGEGLGTGWVEAVHPDDRERVTSIFAAATEGRAPFELDYRLRTARGDYRWATDAARPRCDESGEFAGFIGAVFDVHERKAAENALRDADRRKDEFLAVLAHELRNPLAPLRSGLEVLRRARPGGEDAASARDMMQRQVDHMVCLLDDLLDTSRIARGKFELHCQTIDLVEAARNALETSLPLLESRGHRVRAQLPDVPLRVHADPVRIAQVLTNLLNNAAHYTEPGGCVSVSVQGHDGEASVRVEDDGIGIPGDMLERVFEPFVQLETSRRGRQNGLGLGLALARSILRLHGGTIHAARGAGGRGSVFTVRLRLDPQDAAERGPGPGNEADRAAVQGLRVLVVDDNRDAAESLGMLLGMLGHDVRLAHDGAGALEAFGDGPADVVFLDLGMPGMDGYEVARRLRQSHTGATAYVVALSGYGQPGDRRRTREAGFDTHLVKPADIDAIEALLAARLSERTSAR
jgi:PAS domain S-box-containing protein